MNEWVGESRTALMTTPLKLLSTALHLRQHRAKTTLPRSMRDAFVHAAMAGRGHIGGEMPALAAYKSPTVLRGTVRHARTTSQGTVLHAQRCEAQCCTRRPARHSALHALAAHKCPARSLSPRPSSFHRQRAHRRRTQGENDASAGHARCLCACCVVVIRFGGHTPALAAYKFPARS